LNGFLIARKERLTARFVYEAQSNNYITNNTDDLHLIFGYVIY